MPLTSSHLEFYFLILFPHALQCVFWKNTISPHRLLGHGTIRPFPQDLHFSAAKVLSPQKGHEIIRGLPQPGQIASFSETSLMQEGHRSTKGLRLPQPGQKRESDSIKASQKMQFCLYDAINFSLPVQR
jgi:hypothetical protein